MNFYKHHLGDYDGHTAHLTWDEDMAYTRLLRAYYRREKGIPDAEKYRLSRAATKSQKAAVDRVLDEFFTKQGDEWRQKRCDEEIQSYQNQCQKNREVGKLGGRPRKTDEVIKDNPNETEVVSRNNPNQNQIPEPDKNKHSPSASFDSFWKAWPPNDRKAAKGKCWELWRKKKCDGVADEIIRHVEALKRSDGWREGYIPAPKVYLNESRWEGAELSAPSREETL